MVPCGSKCSEERSNVTHCFLIIFRLSIFQENNITEHHNKNHHYGDTPWQTTKNRRRSNWVSTSTTLRWWNTLKQSFMNLQDAGGRDVPADNRWIVDTPVFHSINFYCGRSNPITSAWTTPVNAYFYSPDYKTWIYLRRNSTIRNR